MKMNEHIFKEFMKQIPKSYRIKRIKKIIIEDAPSSMSIGMTESPFDETRTWKNQCK